MTNTQIAAQLCFFPFSFVLDFLCCFHMRGLKASLLLSLLHTFHIAVTKAAAQKNDEDNVLRRSIDL